MKYLKNLAVYLFINYIFCSFFLPADSYAISLNFAQSSASSTYDLNIDSPRGLTLQLKNAVKENDIEAVKNLLDVRHLNSSEKSYLSDSWARKLIYVLNHFSLPDYTGISNNRLGTGGDGLPHYRDLIKTFEFKEKSLNLYVDRVKSGLPEGKWFISPVTLYQLDDFHSYMRENFDFYQKYLPQFFFSTKIFGLSFYLCINLLLMIGLSWIITYFAAKWPIHPLIKKMASRSPVDQLTIHSTIEGPLKKCFFFIVLTLLIHLADRPFMNPEFTSRLKSTFLLLATFFPILGFIDLSQAIIDQKLKLGTNGGVPSSSIGKSVIKFIVYLLFFLVIVQNFGIDLTAVFAGLGVGGIAVALAGQKTIENLFGGLSLIMDRPVVIGDYCAFDGKTGTIEAIGLRSIKIRTLDRSLIAIPNSKFSEMEIENFAKRDSLRLKFRLGLSYNTQEAILKRALFDIRSYLSMNPEVSKAYPLRVHLIDFSDSAIVIEVYCYIATSVWNHYLVSQEEIRFKILDILNKLGIVIAYPTQNINLNSPKT